MKTLIFSDTHLSHHFDPAQCALLQKEIEKADRVIINGDFFDSYLTTFDKFVKSPWSALFPLLKKRQTIYLTGNHDMPSSFDDRWQLFADQVAQHVDVHAGDTTYHIEHGHLYAFSFEVAHPHLSRLGMKLYPLLDSLEHKANIFSHYYLEYLREKHRANDRELMDFSKKNLRKGRWHVFGHSHTQRKDDESQYLNSGMFRYGFANWITIDDTDSVVLHTAHY